MLYNSPMKFTLKYLLMFLIIFSFSACQLFEDSLEKQEKKQELELKKLQIEHEKALADIELQKSLASIEKEKSLELQKLQNEIKSKELSTDHEAELEIIKQKVALQQSNNTLSFQIYLLAFLAFAIAVVSAFVFYYLKRKRENELRAYEDNLKKYFYHKENITRMRIAEKVLDTIKDGDLSKENEKKLINAFAKDQHDYNEDAEIITEEESASNSSEDDVEAIEHKEKNEG